MIKKQFVLRKKCNFHEMATHFLTLQTLLGQLNQKSHEGGGPIVVPPSSTEEQTKASDSAAGDSSSSSLQVSGMQPVNVFLPVKPTAFEAY